MDLFVILGAVIAIVIILVIIFVVKKTLMLAVNTVIGFLALFATQAFWLQDLSVNFWTSLIVGIFGIFGYIGILIWHFLF